MHGGHKRASHSSPWSKRDKARVGRDKRLNLYARDEGLGVREIGWGPVKL